ncbi:DUF4132 domain-containing protein [Aridibaculum aurantiacum]|uniref:DUF4132 domain-containing protein n=1 Tax=Aridibaculum aurantiacum TaxID=2810307 RepID=UPI001A9766D5|nr:DUF4132 domain-containing protein [Aridibaculum aurantiacum]
MSILNAIKKAVSSISGKDSGNPFEQMMDEMYREFVKTNVHYWEFKPNENEVFKQQVVSLSDKEKVLLLQTAIKSIAKFTTGNNSWSSNDKEALLANMYDSILRHLLKMRLSMDDEDIIGVLQMFFTYRRYNSSSLMHWPIAAVIGQVEKQLKTRAASKDLLEILSSLKDRVQKDQHYYAAKEQAKIIEKIDQLLFSSTNNQGLVKPTWFVANDDLAVHANAAIEAMNDTDRQQWFKLMQHAQKASGGSPSKKYVDEAKTLFEAFGAAKFKHVVNDWFVYVASLKDKVTEYTNEHNGQVYTYSNTTFLTAQNLDILKGFIWMCVHFHDKNTLFNLAALAERAYRKIPGQGPAAPSVGNACIYVLGNVKGLDGVGLLSRLKLRIKQNNTQNLINKYMLNAAEKQGVSLHEIEDMAVDDFDLELGSKTYEFDGFKAVLNHVATGKTELLWFKPDGSPQKSVPAVVKEKHAAKLKKIKDTIKQVELTSTAQRDRIDRMFKSGRSLRWQQFQEYYLNHGLMCLFARKMIWTLEEGGKKENVLYLDDQWVSLQGVLSFEPGEDTLVRLWHPVASSVQEISDWRNFLVEREIVQPLKQAFREVYLLTDAEITTRTYSNRMAAHILKQHQFNSLAKTRGWKYSLLGSYDDGRDNEIACIELPDYGLTAEFWINEVNAEDAYNDTGIWLYVATDQVRFVRTGTRTVIELLDVPALAFSEVMRDVDLFVGVASVGNDPQWRDSGGLPAYRDYWQAYSFGDLTEVAKTRKSILERMLPRLKVGKVATIRDKFLVVKGKLRTYKIHIGSTNILMEPNDQYLCIVPGRSTDNASTLFLPFEGDNGLSVILSKAVLLADDDKITDPTITSQINTR